MSINQNGLFYVKAGNKASDSIVDQITLTVTVPNGNTNFNTAVKGISDLSLLTGNVGHVHAGEFRTQNQNVAAVINGTNAALRAVIDISNGANTAGANGAYCMVLDDVTANANTTRGAGAAPTAFIGIGEEAAAGNQPMQFLMDIGRPGKNVVSAANATVVWSTNNTVNTGGMLPTASNGGALRIRVNGATRWLQLSTSLNR